MRYDMDIMRFCKFFRKIALFSKSLPTLVQARIAVDVPKALHALHCDSEPVYRVWPRFGVSIELKLDIIILLFSFALRTSYFEYSTDRSRYATTNKNSLFTRFVYGKHLPMYNIIVLARTIYNCQPMECTIFSFFFLIIFFYHFS